MNRHARTVAFRLRGNDIIEAVGTAGSVYNGRTVFIIDDDIAVRKSLHFLLASSSITAWPFAAAVDFIEQLPELSPAPIMLDLRMPGIDGLQVLAILKKRSVDWPVIVITAHGDVTAAVRAMKLGAIDFLEKPFELDELYKVLDRAFEFIDQNKRSSRKRDDSRRLIGSLTKRETEVIEVLIEGVSNKVAAYRLGLSIRTVEMHRRNTLLKLGVKSMTEVVFLMVSAELLPQYTAPTLDEG